MTAVEFNHQMVNLKPNLEKFALSLTSDSEKAKDLLQETYLKAFANRDKFVEYSNLKAWAFTIMKNTFINNYRRAIKQNTRIDNTKDLYYINQTKEAKVGNPESALTFGEINNAINNLEDEYRLPFVLHTSGFKYKEIAEELDLKIGTVKSRIFFSRRKLMDKLKAYQS